MGQSNNPTVTLELSVSQLCVILIKDFLQQNISCFTVKFLSFIYRMYYIVRLLRTKSKIKLYSSAVCSGETVLTINFINDNSKCPYNDSSMKILGSITSLNGHVSKKHSCS